jgi:peptidoglycan hydrolase CwlO-like protein
LNNFFNDIGLTPQENEHNRIRDAIAATASECKSIEQSIASIQNEISKVERNIEAIESRPQETNAEKTIKSEIDRLEREIREAENSFNEIAKACKIEWFRNEWMTYKPQNLINEIKYWLT